ncbi:glycosyltransferase family 2 protein [Bacillus sp. AGMB 02131]|uniref:Glycosyltransferase family 2 protein n=1 Tax=Peribacillus faecalis TaxID=2772559 RepID=A0A927HDU1_9BACI|nr:glycosyltransferase [Peribacillus faecalis]MBD3109823.1 glycosyltransferase family 2 protein [Peribacillus faecalis]
MFHWIILIIILISATFIAFHMINGFLAIKKQIKYKLNKQSSQQGISVLVPCFNEENTVTSSIQSINNILTEYPNLEYIFINDGSTDDTLINLAEKLQLVEINKDYEETIFHQPMMNIYESTLYPNVFVLNKVNGGKADALNAGINFATNELIVTLDADTLLDKGALPIVNEVYTDDSVIAGGGTVNILQSQEYTKGKMQLRKLKLLIKLQIMDYLKGFIILKASLSRLNALNVVSGTFGVFRKSLLLELGGYRVTIGEDMDITLKFQLYAMANKGKRIVYIPNAIAYTECPATWRDLFSQRIRWHKAYVDCFLLYSGSLFKRFFKGALPFFFIIDTTFLGVGFTMFSLFYLSYLAIVKFSVGSLIIILIYIVCISIISITSNLLALYLYKLQGGRFEEKNALSLFLTIIADIIIFRFCVAVFMVLGTIFYFINRKKWNTVSRTGEVYYSKDSRR